MTTTLPLKEFVKSYGNEDIINNKNDKIWKYDDIQSIKYDQMIILKRKKSLTIYEKKTIRKIYVPI